MGLSLAKQLIRHEKTVVLSAKFTILISWFPVCTLLIPNFLILKWVRILVATTYRKLANGQSCKTSYMMRVNGSEKDDLF